MKRKISEEMKELIPKENIEESSEEEEDDSGDEDLEQYDQSVDEDSEEDEKGICGDDEEENVSGDEGGDSDENLSGWADAMTKVLNSAKAVDSKKIILSKARKDVDRKYKKETESEKREDTTEIRQKSSILRAKKLDVEGISRSKPDIVKDKAKEKAFNKIATRGVVQLFNAVRAQQKDLKQELQSVGKSTRKREKVYRSIDKESFLENVLGAKKTDLQNKEMSDAVNSEPMLIDGKEEENKGWNILRDDFMIDAKMKDWDKNSDSEG